MTWPIVYGAALLLALGAIVYWVRGRHRPRPTDHLFPDAFTAMGHRGCRGLAPENTKAAFDIATKLGVPFELDTCLLRSGELAVFHDDTLERVTQGRGPIADRTLTELRTLEAGAHFSPEFTGEPIPLLRDVLAQYGSQVVINIEVKSTKGSPNEALGEAVVEAVQAAGLSQRVIITSFNPFLLEVVRNADPSIARGQIYGTFKGANLKFYEKLLLRWLAFNHRAQPDCLMIEATMLTQRYLKGMQAKGYRVFPWTVNEPEEMDRLRKMGVDGLITDFPDILLKRMATQRS